MRHLIKERFENCQTGRPSVVGSSLRQQTKCADSHSAKPCCPECGGTLLFLSGCHLCPACGFSPCG